MRAPTAHLAGSGACWHRVWRVRTGGPGDLDQADAPVELRLLAAFRVDGDGCGSNAAGSPVARSYTEAGTLPGRWLGWPL